VSYIAKVFLLFEQKRKNVKMEENFDRETISQRLGNKGASGDAIRLELCAEFAVTKQNPQHRSTRVALSGFMGQFPDGELQSAS
jgi:hypothetical protein